MHCSRQIAICNDDCIFAAYSHNICRNLQFAVDDEVVITIHFEWFPPGTVRKLHARRTYFYRVLRKIASITHELDIPCITPIFIREDSTLFFMHVPF